MHVLSLAFFANAGFEVPLVDFKGSDPKLTHTWKPNNDPVMGGQSYSTVVVQNEVLNFTGKCAIVPSLQAPGFITAVNSDKAPWVDVSGCEGLKITSKSTIPYSGFRISFGNAHPIGGKFFASGVNDGRGTSQRAHAIAVNDGGDPSQRAHAIAVDDGGGPSQRAHAIAVDDGGGPSQRAHATTETGSSRKASTPTRSRSCSRGCSRGCKVRADNIAAGRIIETQAAAQAP